jgi:hypothetical protein
MRDGVAWFVADGEGSLVEAVELISRAIVWSREKGADKLLFDCRRFAGVSIPTLIDRFLMIEDWAEASQGMVRVVLVVRAEYIQAHKFGVKVAVDFGLTANVFSSESDALAWLNAA